MTTRMKSKDRRAAIVTAAIHLFAEKGFRGATTRGLAAALGVSGPVLYQHFNTKRDLYSAIIETKAAQRSERAGPAVLAALYEGGDDRAFFFNLGDVILGNYEEDPDFMRLLLFSALERHELADLFFERQMQDYFTLVTSYIQRRMDEGQFLAADAETAARAFHGMISHSGLMRMLFGERFATATRAELVRQMVEIFLCGVAA